MKKSNPIRRLAAVMFTDIVGYTALMQQDEAKATAIRARHRQVFDQQHQLNNGEILQYFGDGTLSVFQSGVEAVECAISMQKELQKGEKVPLRIGLHIGDIVFDGTEIFGDGVNLAARIESLGLAGAVLLSGKLNEELRNHPHISTVSLGNFELKNIAYPVEVFAVSDEGLKKPARHELKGKRKQNTKTIAVLPFVNMSADPENEYFSDGMTEEIINALAKIKGLKVTSRTSSFYFKNKTIPVRQIGQELNVAIILEGSVRLAGNKMRITAQLIDVAEDFHFWSETFDRSVEDIFAIQDEISLLIADRLREHVGHFDYEDRLANRYEIPVETYKKYLKSRYHIFKMTKPDMEKGLVMLKEIIQEYPNFALAHLGIHLVYTLLGTIGLMPSIEAFTKGQAFLDKAIELDDTLPECQLQLSYIAFFQKWDYQSGYEHLNKAFERRPTVEYYQSMTSALLAERKFDAALTYIETALQLDPFYSINYHLKGFVFYVQEKYDQATEYFDRALQLSPGFMASTLYKGLTLLLAGHTTEGLTYFEQLPSDEEEDVLKLGGTTLAYATMGQIDKAELGIAQLEKKLQTAMMERVLNFLILCQAALGKEEQTLQLIEQGLANRWPLLVYLYVDPFLKPLYTNPRFQDFVKQIIGEEPSASLTKRKYKKALLDIELLEKYKYQLEALMAEEKPYLNPDLTLRVLADKMDIPANHLSRLLNEGFDKNFSEFVNSYRLEIFKTKMADPELQHLTILGLAYESGFNSKTVFNSFFKKMTGKTPKAYQKELKAK